VINGRHILIRISSDPAVLRSCHIVFVPASQMQGYTPTGNALAELSVLTVGEVRDFIDRGGIMNFVMQNDHLRFEVNPIAAASHHLRVSSRLLQLSVGDGRHE
jgi:hypothetical protein